MSLEFDDKGKIFTNVVSKVEIPAMIQTIKHLIRGNIHVRRNERLKDELDRDELFLAITEAQVVGEDDKVLHEARFLAVQRSQVIWVVPIRDLDDGGKT